MASVSADFTIAVSAENAQGMRVSASVRYRGPQQTQPLVVFSMANPQTGEFVHGSVDLATAKRICDEINSACIVAQKLAGRAQRILDRVDD